MLNYNLTAQKPALISWSKNMTNARLVAEFQGGNKAGFEVLLHRYYKLVYWYIHRYIPDTEKCEDVFQDTLIYVYNMVASKKFVVDQSNDEHFKALFLSTAKYRILYNFSPGAKHANHDRAVPLDIRYHQDIADASSDEDNAEDLHARLAVAVQQLPKDEKQVVVLTTYMNCSISEVARLTHTNSNTAVARYQRALMSLKQALTV